MTTKFSGRKAKSGVESKMVGTQTPFEGSVRPPRARPKIDRLEKANRDAKRKRDKRGGYKNISRLLEEHIASFPEEQQEAARWFYHVPLEKIRDAEEALRNGEPEPMNRLKPTVWTADARRRKREEFRLDGDREIVEAYEKFFRDEDLQKWLAERHPNPKYRNQALFRMRESYEASLARLNEHRRKNALKQRKHRDSHLDHSRKTEATKTRARRASQKQARLSSPFVAIDAEGVNIGSAFHVEADAEDQTLDLGLPERASDDRGLSAQDHRTFLWGAGGDDGNPVWLGGQNKNPLSAQQICEWLLSLTVKFPGANFVMFAAGYDWTQIFRDMPYEKAWELWNGLPWSEHESPTGTKSNRRRFMLWRDYGLRLYPGKFLEIVEFKNPDKIKNAKGEYDVARKIKIFDTFGFFQSSFVKAATGFGGGFLHDGELDTILSGKSRRAEFAGVSLEEIRKYTAVELRVLARMMTKLREGLKRVDLEIKDWHGAGCISQAMMKKDQVTNYYPDVSAEVRLDDLSDPLAWGLRAFFGGRAELIKQGVHLPRFFNYDISSAYPHILRQLPNMKNGKWVLRNADYLLSEAADRRPISQFKRSRSDLQLLLERLGGMSLVSMVRVRFHFPPCHRRVIASGQLIIDRRDLPWFPLPIRANDGTIYFPRQGEGIYAVEEVRAVLRWATRVYENAKENDFPIIALLGALEFMPVNDAKPFRARVENGFAERVRIIQATAQAKKEWERDGKRGPEPYDIGEIIWKLGLNSIYGKTAQSIGGRVVRDAEGAMRAKPPKLTNPFFAAAITAGTRAMLLDAAAGDVDAVILFATDGICSIRELPGVESPQIKTLGAWEKSSREHGVFMKSGIYSHRPSLSAGLATTGTEATESKPKKPTTKMRGIRPSSLPPGVTAEQWLIESVPQAWKRDEQALRFPYRAYKTFGAALASRESWKLAGHWVEGMREADIQRVSAKRDCRGVARTISSEGEVTPGERRREFALFDTAAAENPLGFELSRPYSPDWLDERNGARASAEEEQKTLERKSGFGFDVED